VQKPGPLVSNPVSCSRRASIASPLAAARRHMRQDLCPASSPSLSSTYNNRAPPSSPFSSATASSTGCLCYSPHRSPVRAAPLQFPPNLTSPPPVLTFPLLPVQFTDQAPHRSAATTATPAAGRAPPLPAASGELPRPHCHQTKSSSPPLRRGVLGSAPHRRDRRRGRAAATAGTPWPVPCVPGCLA
jgi:hypothetical protein